MSGHLVVNQMPETKLAERPEDVTGAEWVSDVLGLDVQTTRHDVRRLPHRQAGDTPNPMNLRPTSVVMLDRQIRTTVHRDHPVQLLRGRHSDTGSTTR